MERLQMEGVCGFDLTRVGMCGLGRGVVVSIGRINVRCRGKWIRVQVPSRRYGSFFCFSFFVRMWACCETGGEVVVVVHYS